MLEGPARHVEDGDQSCRQVEVLSDLQVSHHEERLQHVHEVEAVGVRVGEAQDETAVSFRSHVLEG